MPFLIFWSGSFAVRDHLRSWDHLRTRTDLQPDFNENYNLSDDIGIPTVDANYEPLMQNELKMKSVARWFKY